MTTAAQQVAVRIRYFAGARAAAGVAEETLVLPSPVTVGDALSTALSRHDERLAKVLKASSFLLDGLAVHGHETAIEGDTTLDVLPPFAGG